MKMRVLYHIPTPRPKRPECDAVHQEIAALSDRFGGAPIHVHPSEYTRWPLPRLLFGLREARALRWREQDVDIHHIYNPDPYAYPYLRLLKKPIVYTLSAGLRGTRRFPVPFFSRIVAQTVVSDAADAQQLRKIGVLNAEAVPTGIDLSRFRFTQIECDGALTVLSGSAPWTRKQFLTKGVDALLDAATRFPSMRLVFLWRGYLLDEMMRRVSQRDLQARVDVVDEIVDVNRVLAGVHAAVVLASDASAIKAYPHSLIEALAAGRPIVISRGIPMADWAEREGCGVVVERLEPEAVGFALERLRADYTRLQANAHRAGRDAFPIEKTLTGYEAVYQRAMSLGAAHGR